METMERGFFSDAVNVPNGADAQTEYAYHSALSASKFPGANYLVNLHFIHDHLKADTYLEIGVAQGSSLAMAGNQCHAIGIDPGFTLSRTIRAWAKLFYMPSDDFFQQHNPEKLFGGKKIKLSFIDGLHTFDQVFRDLINVMPYLATDSHVILHDVYPVHPVPAERVRKSIFWTGDVWKVVFLIKEFLPQLRFMTIPTGPSGLFLLKGFDGLAPNLDMDAVHKRIDQLFDETFEQHAADLPDVINVGSNDFDAIKEWLDAL